MGSIKLTRPTPGYSVAVFLLRVGGHQMLDTGVMVRGWVLIVPGLVSIGKSSGKEGW